MRIVRTMTLLLIAFALSVGFAAAQSLVEVAKKEKKRRETNKAESKKVITEQELSRSYGSLPATRSTTVTTTGGEDADESAAGDDAQAEGEEPDETKTPEYWQNRVTAAKDKIARLEQELQDTDWGEGQAVGVDPRGANNLARRQQAEQNLQAARAELEAIRAEARRAGVPPGWVR